MGNRNQVMSNLKAKTAKQLATALAKKETLTFSFVKRNGDLRSARATTHNSLIPKAKQATITNEQSMNSVRFFDLTINEWRSVAVDTPIYF